MTLTLFEQQNNTSQKKAWNAKTQQKQKSVFELRRFALHACYVHIENTSVVCHAPLSWGQNASTRSLEFFLFFFIRSLFADDIKVIFLQEAKIFASFREFTFFHTFSDIPMHVSPL